MAVAGHHAAVAQVGAALALQLGRDGGVHDGAGALFGVLGGRKRVGIIKNK